MKELESKINIEIKSQPDFDKSLKARFVDYDIKYKSFSAIWEFTNQAYHHSLWYNPNKASIVKSSMKNLAYLSLIMLVIVFSANAQDKLIAKSEINLTPVSDLTWTENWKKAQSAIFSSKYKGRIIESQDTLTYQIITLDDNEFIGSIVEQDGLKIVFNTTNFGQIIIQKNNIKSMVLIEPSKLKNGVLWEDHLQSTRHFWSPNGYGLKKGEAYFQNVWLFFNQISVGVTDNILIGGGIIPLFLLGGLPTPIWITPKVSFPAVKDKVNVGVGGLFATVLGEEEDMNLGIAYGTATFGPRDKNVSLGVGYGYAGNSWANRPAISLSFISRVGRRGYFISENYLLADTFIGMIGGRSILGTNNISLDYGAVVPIGIGEFIVLPWLGLTVPLGKKKTIN